MNDRIDVTTGEWRRVSMTYAWADVVTTLIAGVVVAGFASVPAGIGTGWPWWTFVIMGGVFGLFVVIALFSFFRVRTIGYQLRADDLLMRRGMIYRRFVAVPYGRMQMVDITRGPIERMLGLSQLKFITAAATTAVSLPGLKADEAERLRDHLVTVAETRRAGL